MFKELTRRELMALYIRLGTGSRRLATATGPGEASRREASMEAKSVMGELRESWQSL